MKKMKKLINQIIGSFLLLIFLSNCSSVKDALSYTKKPSGDEFLVKKKDPLTMPPEFNILPEPNTINNSTKYKSNDKKNFDLQGILSNKSNTKTSPSKISNDSLEKSIIKKINKE
jgi:hypothetical protein|tara:strand:- start:1855 stop:2199 length:345 start_codon:yes stop_codon:yes gene_type:complete